MYGMIGSIVNAAGNLTSNLTANAANQKTLIIQKIIISQTLVYLIQCYRII